MEKKKKNIVIGITSLLLATLLLLGLTYAYYKTRIVGNSNEKSVSVVSKNLSVTYQNESAEISATGIEPGYSATKTFEVKNTGSETVEYSVMLDNVTNTFARTEDWTYTISEGGTTLKSGTLPASTSYILYSESIDAGATKSYTLKIDYADLEDVDQSEDMGKSLTFRINIDNATASTLTSADEGTLLYAIGRDNVISEPLSVPGKSPSGVVSYAEVEKSSDANVTAIGSECFILYGTGYTFDKESGTYDLTGVTITSDIYTNNYDELVGKYISYENLYNVGSNTKEATLARNIQTTSLDIIYKVTSATADSYTLQTLDSKIDKSINEAILARTEDDYGTSYYFRGNVTNNYVNYSGMCWRIVRVQGDGTIKLTLERETQVCNPTGYNVGPHPFINSGTAYNYTSNTSKSDDFLYENSNVHDVLETWATTDDKLDTTKLVDAEWCNDTAKTSESGNGYLYYGAYDRLMYRSIAKPTLKCNMIGMEGTEGIEAMAQKYVGKIALLTADEVVFAGASSEKGTHYLSATSTYFTMTAHSIIGGDIIQLFVVSNAIGSNVTAQYKIRPAVVLASNVTISSGDGTQTNPYVIN